MFLLVVCLVKMPPRAFIDIYMEQRTIGFAGEDGSTQGDMALQNTGKGLLKRVGGKIDGEWEDNRSDRGLHLLFVGRCSKVHSASDVSCAIPR